MNQGVLAGMSLGSPAGAITRYIQTPTITSSRTIPVPPGVQRIEALLCGGGGCGRGGGFGGLSIYVIPVTGAPLVVVIGAGNAAAAIGGSTSVTSANTKYAEVGGGGGANDATFGNAGRSGGGGGGGNSIQAITQYGGNGGAPYPGELIWNCYPNAYPKGTNLNFELYRAGVNGLSGPGGAYQPSAIGFSGGEGALGGGGGGGGASGTLTGGGGGSGGGGGQGDAGTPVGRFGGAGGTNNSGFVGAGGSLATVSIWGYTGFAGDPGGAAPAGGGGGMLSAGSGYNGGNGGGGAAFFGGVYGTSGNGFAAIRFYM